MVAAVYSCLSIETGNMSPTLTFIGGSRVIPRSTGAVLVTVLVYLPRCACWN